MTGTTDYYGRPVLKAPVWKAYIPVYFFTGGLAGASSTLALAARLSGNARLSRSALVTSLIATAASPPLLVADLGRPERFLKMLRVAKPTSPMSVGTWVLSTFAPAATTAAASELTDRLPRLGRVAAMLAGALGPAMATYTAVLVADTAIPAWHGARRELPFLFAGSATAAAAGAALVLTPTADAAAARRLAAVGGAMEIGASKAMEHRLGHGVGAPYLDGEAGRLAKAATALTAGGTVLLMGARRHWVARTAGTLLMAGSLLTRISVFRAGFESATDPAATIGPQRARLAEAGGSA